MQGQKNDRDELEHLIVVLMTGTSHGLTLSLPEVCTALLDRIREIMVCTPNTEVAEDNCDFPELFRRMGSAGH